MLLFWVVSKFTWIYWSVIIAAAKIIDWATSWMPTSVYWVGLKKLEREHVMFNYSFGRRIFSVAVIFCFGIFACPPSSVLGVQEEAAKSDFKSTEVSLTAGDGFPISAMWYEGDKKKAASALILLHELKRDRRDFADLAAYFAKNGHCVIVPDLRGHGKSTVTANGENTLQIVSASRNCCPCRRTSKHVRSS